MTLKHPIYDERDSRRLSEELKHITRQVYSDRLRLSAYDFSHLKLMVTMNPEANFDRELQRFRDSLDELERLRAEALSIMDAFVPQHPMRELSQI